MPDVLTKPKWLAAVALFAFCVAPTYISYRPYLYAFDDSDYLLRSMAVSRAFWSGNVHGLGVAMVGIHPPAMTLMGLPWGPLASWNAAGKCFVTLAAVISLLAASCLYLLLRIGVEPLYLVLASACSFASMGPYPPGANAHATATAFLSDSLLAWTTLAAILLIPWEARTNSSSIKSAVLRGVLWGTILSLGAITKISFMYFIVLVIPSLFLIRFHRAGLRPALASLVACACWSSPAVFYLIRWGGRTFDNAKSASFGQWAGFYYTPLLQFVGTTVRESPGVLISCVLVAAGLIYVVIKKRTALLGPDFLALLIMIGFAIVVLRSPSRLIRYSFPALIALPFITAILISKEGQAISRRSAVLAAGLVFCGLLVSGSPTRLRPMRQSLSRCDAVLAEAAKHNAKHVLLATDSPTLNKNLMDLDIDVSESRAPVEAGTLAYQAISGAPIQEDFHTINESDLVVFQDREDLGSQFTNQRASEYERHIQQLGVVPIRIANDLTIYSLCCRP